MIKFNFLVFLLFPLFSYGQLEGKVIRVIDGDTVELLNNANETMTIRLADIDCPERGQPFGNNAKQFTSSEVFGLQVKVVSKGKDRYGRTIGFVIYSDTLNLSQELLLSGLAWHYKKYSTTPFFQSYEDYARDNGIGLWEAPGPIEPWNWRRN